MANVIRRFKGAFKITQGYWELLQYAFGNLKVLRIPPVREVFHRQIYFTGVQALKIVSILALLCGTLVATQVTSLVGGNSELTVKILIWTVVREIGPLLAAMIIIARSSTAVASELALMKTHNELASLEQMHISPKDYLVVPRISGITLAVVALSVYFQIVAIGGGLAMSALFQNVAFADQLNRFFQIVSVMEFLVVVLKGCLFGMVIATISCYYGMHAMPSITEVPKAAIKAVIQCLLFVFLLDALIAYIYLA